MSPTTKIRQDTRVFTYLKACLISVGFMHMGGKEPRARPGCGGGSGREALLLDGSEASGPASESRANLEAATSATIRRHSRATALILTRGRHSHSETFSSLEGTRQWCKYAISGTCSHTSRHCAPQSELLCPAEEVDTTSCYTQTVAFVSQQVLY